MIASKVRCSDCRTAPLSSCSCQRYIAEHREASSLLEQVRVHQCSHILSLTRDGSRCRPARRIFVVQPGQRTNLSHLVSSCRARPATSSLMKNFNPRCPESACSLSLAKPPTARLDCCHHFCQQCITVSLKLQHQCPICKEPAKHRDITRQGVCRGTSA